MRHLSDEQSMRIAADGAVGRPRIAFHVERCPECAKKVDDWKAFLGLLRLRTTWGRDPQTMSQERDGLAALIRRMPADRFAELAKMPFSSDLMRAGLEVAHELLRRAPRDSLRLTHVLGDVLARADIELPEIAGDIAKERANALRRLMKYSEALQALDDAEHEYRKLRAPFYELAFVEWGRATVSFALKQFNDARKRSAIARGIFQEHGDEVTAAEVQLLEGGIAFDEGDIGGSRAIFAEAAGVLERHKERPALALAYQNLCTCDLRLGDSTKAREFHRRARALLHRFGMHAELVRLSWSVWEAVAAAGDPDAALPYLQDAAKSFRAIGMAGDAAEVGLDILEQFIVLQRYEEALPLAREIVTICQREGVAVDVAHAAAFLEQAVRAASATPEFVRKTKMFVAARLRGESAALDLNLFDDN